MNPIQSRWTIVLIVGAALLGGCSDPVTPGQNASGVTIYFNGVAYEEETIGVGQSIQLSARVTDSAGDVVSGATVQWSSDAAGIVAVDGSGVVTGIAAGTGHIIASHSTGSDTALVNIALPLTGSLTCDGSTDLGLQVGQTAVVEDGAASRICLPGGAGGAGYVLSVVNASASASSRLSVSVASAGVLGGDGPSLSLVPPKPSGPREDEQFHLWMRERVSDRLAGRLATGVDPLAFGAAASAAGVGDLLTFNVESTSGDGCSQNAINLHGARIRAESQRAIVAADTLNPAGGFTDSDYQEFARYFDEEVWPLVTGAFGTPSDIDRNSKVYLLFTRGVNERPENTSASSGIYVGGFFFNRDLFPKTGASSCAGSNEREMFYLLVPDPNGEVSGRRFRTDFVRQSTRSVLVHEFQHLVNDSRRLHVNRAPEWEETWLNEGLSHIAEELMFYKVSGKAPRGNFGAADLNSVSVRSAFETYQLNNIERLATYLRQPSTNSLMGVDVLATRGAAWHFLRYAADRSGDETGLWRKLVTDPTRSGLANLENAFGADPKEWIRDWGAAVELDDLLPVDARYQVPSWNLRSVYPALTNYWPADYYEIYPLSVQNLNGTKRQYEIRGGGGAYVTAGVAAGGRGAVRFTVGDLPAPSRLKVLVTRTR